MTIPAKIPAYRKVELHDIDGVVTAVYHWQTYRFLMSDGSTIDVRAVRDDSDLRGAVLSYTKLEKIEGAVTLPEPKEPAPMPQPRKRPPRRT